MMVCAAGLVVRALVFLVGVLSVIAVPQLADFPRVDELQYRDTGDNNNMDASKPVRDNGLGSLLLKNLRFRDLSRREKDLLPLADSLSMRYRYPEIIELLEKALANQNELGKDISKRGSMSVSRLAALLSSLKERSADDGVKLQSLRFGRR